MMVVSMAHHRQGVGELHRMVGVEVPRRQGVEELHRMVEAMAPHRKEEEAPRTLDPYTLGELHTMEEGAGAPHTLGVWVCCICGRLGRGSYSCAWCGQCGHP